MYLTGGSASIRNLDKLIAQETDLKVNTVKNPEASVIRGISLIVSDSQYKKLMYEPKQSHSRKIKYKMDMIDYEKTI